MLFERQLVISMFAYPQEADANYIYYLVVEEDTNQDGRLDASDVRHLYISDLNGLNLRRLDFPKGRVILSTLTEARETCSSS